MIIATDASRVAAELLFESEAVHRTVEGIMVHHGQLLRTRVQAKASGRPGPNIVTGDYRRSISMSVESTPTSTTVTVGTNSPQGRRLEFGFHGVDSLGRYYNQPPFEHFGPAVDDVVPGLVRSLEGAVK
jgi:hypothetical protein